MSDERGIGRDRDLVLSPGQFAFIQDETKGGLNVYVGPYKTSLANTDRPGVFVNGRFTKAGSLDQTIQDFPIAREGSYIVLENPAPSGEGEHPQAGTSSVTNKLLVGSKINIAGPISFALWPGQVATVVPGHRLRSNQYLMVRVYNEEQARRNWSKSVMVKKSEQTSTTDTTSKDGTTPPPTPPTPPPTTPEPDLTMGQMMVIRGNEVSFYIPPTGIEVIPDENGEYTREAVTLERLEYCMLLDENGSKRYVRGPAVVFPEPTETFVSQDGAGVKRRAIELTDEMGVYVKVTADYSEGEHEHKMGDELFITGKDQKIYYPREEHALIKYGTQERHFGVAIPGGEARYLMNKQTGSVKLVKGPTLLLPDPRREVLIRRVLEDRQVKLWFPNNEEALQHNARLREVTRQSLNASASYAAISEESVTASMPAQRHVQAASRAHAGDNFQRGTSYTQPRTLTLDTKYEGAVSIAIWQNYAVLIVNKQGNTRVVCGPQTAILEYDESLQVLSLSTGKPKNTDKLQETVYLKVTNNAVTDYVEVETADMVRATIKVAYRVNFEGDDQQRWFAVENYVKQLCDHARSRLRSAVKQIGIEELNSMYSTIVRDVILGKKAEGEKARQGMYFEENHMRVYEVEVLKLDINDPQIMEMLARVQRETVEQTLGIGAKERRLVMATREGDVTRQTLEVESLTLKAKADADQERIALAHSVTLSRVEKEAEIEKQRLESQKVAEELQSVIDSIVLARSKLAQDQEFSFEKLKTDERLRELEAETTALVEKAKAISPDFIAALQSVGDKVALVEVAKSMAPLAILGGESVQDVLSRLLAGTPLGKVLALPAANGNGATTRS